VRLITDPHITVIFYTRSKKNVRITFGMSDAGHPRRLIVIDDSSTIHAVLHGMLTERGWVLESYRDGESGAQAALRKPPDAVVCDQWMPGISGIQLCRLLREDPRTAGVPLVILTGTTTTQGRFWAMESGASAYLAKHSISTLATLLDQLEPITLSRRRTSVPEAEQRSISARLGHLLDASLFEAVLSNKFRGIATNVSTTLALIEQVAALLTQVLPVRWIAVAPHEHPDWFLSQHPLDDTAEVEACAALGLSTTHRATKVDNLLCAEGRRVSAPMTSTLLFGGRVIGRLAVGLDLPQWSPQERAILEIAEKDLPVALQLVQLFEQTSKLAMTDSLTGMDNRRCGTAALERLLSSANRHQTPLSIALVDIDHFKSVNDRFGHDGGDTVLKFVASLLTKSIRRSDLAARWGGEEFLLLFPHTPKQGVLLVCERLRRMIEGRSVETPTGAKVAVTVSIGVATASENPSVEHLLRRADNALYAAKDQGRNKLIVAPDEV
jgi:two-component system cell cycle response regulator